MALYTIADLHLSININKPMDVFQGWDNYIQKLADNWKEKISEDDTVVLIGDLCWGKTLTESLDSFKFLNDLPGKKILLKGNHDFWWTTKSKMDVFFKKNNLSTLNILHNNYYVVDGICVCGTRGWMFENGDEQNVKLINREAERLKRSIEGCIKFGLPIVVFLHYPPMYGNQFSDNILSILKQYEVKNCYYGHLHAEGIKNSINKNIDGIEYRLVSSDYLNFSPMKIDF